MSNNEPTNKAPQAQGQETKQQAPAAKPEAPKQAASKPAAKPQQQTAKPTSAPAPKAEAPKFPILTLRADPAFFDSRIYTTLIDRRKKLADEEATLIGKLMANRLAQQEVNEKLAYYLSPSPIFASDGVIPSTDPIARGMARVEAVAHELKELVKDKPTEYETAKRVEEMLTPRLDKLDTEFNSLMSVVRNVVEEAPAEGQSELGDLLQPEGGELGQQGDEEDGEDFFEEEGQEEEVLEAVVADHTWTDAYQVPYAPSMEALLLDQLTLEGVGELTIGVIPHDKSRNISAIGAEIARENGESRVCIYVRFKQAPRAAGQPWNVSAMYRYNAFPLDVWEALVDTATRRMQGDESASVGSFVSQHLKALHDAGQVACQRLDRNTGTWVNAQTKAERMAAKGQQVSAPVTAPRPAPVPARPAVVQPRTVPADKPIGTLGDALKRAGVGQPRPIRAGDLDDPFMSS